MISGSVPFSLEKVWVCYVATTMKLSWGFMLVDCHNWRSTFSPSWILKKEPPGTFEILCYDVAFILPSPLLLYRSKWGVNAKSLHLVFSKKVDGKSGGYFHAHTYFWIFFCRIEATPTKNVYDVYVILRFIFLLGLIWTTLPIDWFMMTRLIN